jgi:hypothetical protein
MSRHHQALNRWRLAAARKQRLTLAALNTEPCCICHGTIDYQLDGRHRLGPTIEHHPSLAEAEQLIAAGLHDPYAMASLLPAHRTCNTRKGAHDGNLRRKQRAQADVTALRM